MFGLLISGRPVNATPDLISQTQYAFKLSSSPSFSHIAIFLLPGSSFPENYGATVWIQKPPSTDFRFLGALGPAKQSAIFKTNLSRSDGAPGLMVTTPGGGDAVMGDDGGPSSTAPTTEQIVIGISIEPADAVERQVSTNASSASQSAITPLSSVMSPNAMSGVVVRSALQWPVLGNQSGMSTKVLAQRIIGNAFNFLASFNSDTVPLKAFQDWWEKFEKRVSVDPGFLEREQA